MTEQAERYSEEVPEERLDEDGVLDVNPETEVVAAPYSITSYGADFLVDGLIARMDKDDISIPRFDPDVTTLSGIEGFQREFVWTKPQIDRFVESLLLGLPIPGIFLVQEPDNVLLVLDGQQRLLSMHAFKHGIIRGREFRLRYVDTRYRGLRYADLEEEDRRRFDNSIIHATIVRQDVPRNDQSSIYSIFERLNTGGTPLQPHEIRVALYRGPLIKLLRDLNVDQAWRELYGQRSSRLKDQELILRFFALYYGAHKYRRPLKGFLNDYVEENLDLVDPPPADLRAIFQATTGTLIEAVGRQTFRPKHSLNAAVVDSVMVGIASRLSLGPVRDLDSVLDAYRRLISNEDYVAATESSTAAEESVRKRLQLAQEFFSNVQ